MTRTCPRCQASGPTSAFPLLHQEHTPARHDERRRVCPACGFTARAWAFRLPTTWAASHAPRPLAGLVS